MTPGQAVRKHCIRCVGSVRETKDCGGDLLLATGKPCPFYPYRQGKGRPSVKLIRQECLYCMGGSPKLVRKCCVSDCSLHKFRFGTNTNIRRFYTKEDLKKFTERLNKIPRERVTGMGFIAAGPVI